MATLLIVDDSDTARAAIRAVAEQSAIFDRVIEAADGFLGLKYILSESLDVVVCDLEMPGFDGEKLLRAKEVNPGGSNIPFIVVTASDDLNRRTRLLERGAYDVITKPFHGPDLAARLQLHLKIKKLQDELMVKNETLARLSTSDPVTGLRTRRYVSEVLSIEFLRARRYDSPLSIIMGDLDYFKKVNDNFGHLAGDAVLHGVSELLINELRATDVGGRYGGEEILAVLHRCDLQGALVLGERWRGSIENGDFESPDGRKIPVTISLGVAEFHPDMTTADELVEAADQALYRAKDAGRNRVEGAPNS
ncbi:MAG: two-component system cell cycle response regulator [Myxococcota bacterium]